MRSEWTIYDKRTGEQLIGYHETVGVYEFARTDRPQRLYLTMGEMEDALGRISRTTGRKVGCQEVSR